MPRVELDELSNYEFQYHLTVRATDLNYAGHLGNEALLGLIHEARALFLHRLGFNTIDKDAQQIGLIIADLVVNFKAEAFARDQLTIDCRIDEVSQKSFRIFHCVRRAKLVIALVETGIVAYDYHLRQVSSLPKNFMTRLENYRDTV